MRYLIAIIFILFFSGCKDNESELKVRISSVVDIVDRNSYADFILTCAKNAKQKNLCIKNGFNYDF